MERYTVTIRSQDAEQYIVEEAKYDFSFIHEAQNFAEWSWRCIADDARRYFDIEIQNNDEEPCERAGDMIRRMREAHPGKTVIGMPAEGETLFFGHEGHVMKVADRAPVIVINNHAVFDGYLLMACGVWGWNGILKVTREGTKEEYIADALHLLRDEVGAGTYELMGIAMLEDCIDLHDAEVIERWRRRASGTPSRSNSIEAGSKATS